MLEQMLDFLVHIFSNPSVLGIGLALIFAAIWLAIYRPPLLKEPWLWAIIGGSAILTPIALDITAFPVSIWITQFYIAWLGEQVFLQWILLTGLLPLFVAGLVQIGFMLVPVVIYWWRKNKELTPNLGLAAGAVAGAGFGIIEAQWVHNQLLADGFIWDVVQSQGIIALSVFWGRFFLIGWYIGACALAGWGLAKGKGWQLYLITSFLFVLLNYTEYLVGRGLVEPIVGYLLVTVWALLVTGAALWLSMRRERAGKDG